jgi:hypothetical protein
VHQGYANPVLILLSFLRSFLMYIDTTHNTQHTTHNMERE